MNENTSGKAPRAVSRRVRGDRPGQLNRSANLLPGSLAQMDALDPAALRAPFIAELERRRGRAAHQHVFADAVSQTGGVQ